MKCVKCNYENSDISKYCVNCGKKLNKNIALVSLFKMVILITLSLPLLSWRSNYSQIYFAVYILIYSLLDYFIVYKRFKYNIITNLISVILYMLLVTIIIIFMYRGTSEYSLLNIIFIFLAIVPGTSTLYFFGNMIIDFIFYKIKYKNKV